MGNSGNITYSILSGTRSSEATEDHTLRPKFRRIELVEVGFTNHHLERFVETMARCILFNIDDVDSLRHKVRLDLIGSDHRIDAADIAVYSEVGATPRHQPTTWLFSNDDILIATEIGLDSVFR